MRDRIPSRLAAFAGSMILAGAGLLGIVTPAFAIDGCVTPPGSDDGSLCDITASVVQVVPPPGEGTPSVAFSNGTQTNYVKYRVTLTHYAVRNEGFSEVKFIADTSVVNAASPGPANFFAASAATIANAGGAVLANPATACVISATNIVCTFSFNPAFDNPPGNSAQATITFDVTVQSPTGTPAGESQPKLNLSSITTWKEAGGSNEPEYYSLTSTTNLTVPDPKVVNTYVPVAGGTVTTGTKQGAATCVGGPTGSDPNKWVTIVKVPEAAQVGIDLNPFADPAPTAFQFYSTIGIPDPSGAPKLFGVGTHWYDPGAASRLVVNTLRRDVCTVPGSTALQQAAHILQEKIYYKPDVVGAQFQQVLLCIVTSGPTPNNPCIAYAQVYTKYTLPNVPNKDDYLGDHEWVIFANENGRYGTP